MKTFEDLSKEFVPMEFTGKFKPLGEYSAKGFHLWLWQNLTDDTTVYTEIFPALIGYRIVRPLESVRLEILRQRACDTLEL